jgi:hypothetical protein
MVTSPPALPKSSGHAVTIGRVGMACRRLLDRHRLKPGLRVIVKVEISTILR